MVFGPQGVLGTHAKTVSSCTPLRKINCCDSTCPNHIMCLSTFHWFNFPVIGAFPWFNNRNPLSCHVLVFVAEHHTMIPPQTSVAHVYHRASHNTFCHTGMLCSIRFMRRPRHVTDAPFSSSSRPTARPLQGSDVNRRHMGDGLC